jgi:benzoate membrane transport protein
MGASQDQIATAIAVMLLGYGVLSIGLSTYLKMPVSIVWSTPGAAFLASSSALGLSFETAVGAFLVSSLLILLTGLWPALGKLVAKIPPQISSAMLAGVIFPFVVATVHSAVEFPILVMPVVIVWLLLNRFIPLWASPLAISLGFVLIGASPEAADFQLERFWPHLELVIPNFEFGAVVAIGVPLYLITMASQNLPGLAVMSGLGYQLPAGKIFITTGAASAATSLFGGFGLNLAAITAAINADESAAKDPKRRWVAASWGGVVYILFALFAAPFAAFVLAVPGELLLSLAGIALITTFANALKTSVQDDRLRLAGIVTFVIGAAGITIFGIGGAFWALVAGVLISLLSKKN